MKHDRTPAILALLLFAGMAGGCFTEKKAARLHDKIGDRHPVVPAKYCADKYKTDTVTVSGESVITFDTIYVDYIDTVEIGIELPLDTTGRLFPPIKKCKDRIITKTVVRTDTIYRENIARVDQYKIERDNAVKKLTEATEDLKKARTTNKIRFWIIIALGALLFATNYGSLKKMIPKFKI